MTKRVIEVNKSPEQKDEQAFRRTRVDLNELCKQLHMSWFSFQECAHCKRVVEKCDCKECQSRVVFFIHQNELTTGVKFLHKREMAEQVLLFAAANAAKPDMGWIEWAGRRGLHVQAQTSEEKRKEIRHAREALEP